MYQMGRADVPAGQQARAGGADVDAGRVRRRHPAVVAPHRRIPRGPADVSHGRADSALAQGQRGSTLSTAGPSPTWAIVWSQRNTDFYGRDNPEELVEQPWRGFTQALIRARIPHLPVHVDHIDREGPNLARAHPAELGGDVGRASRRRASLRRAGRGADRDRPDQSLQRVGRPSSGFCPGRSLRRQLAASLKRDGLAIRARYSERDAGTRICV